MGHKFRNAMEAKIQEMGGESAYLARVASGESIADIAKSFGASRGFFMFWIARTDERKLKFQAARLRRPAFERLTVFGQKVVRYGGAEAVLSAIANGKTIKAVAVELGCARPTLVKWLKAPDRLTRFQEATLESAGAMADDAMDIVDSVNVEDKETASARVRKAEIQATQRKWRAGITDRQTYGTQEQGGGNLNIGALHLNALIKLGGPRKDIGTPAQPQLEGATITLSEIES